MVVLLASNYWWRNSVYVGRRSRYRIRTASSSVRRSHAFANSGDRLDRDRVLILIVQTGDRVHPWLSRNGRLSRDASAPNHLVASDITAAVLCGSDPSDLQGLMRSSDFRSSARSARKRYRSTGAFSPRSVQRFLITVLAVVVIRIVVAVRSNSNFASVAGRQTGDHSSLKLAGRDVHDWALRYFPRHLCHRSGSRSCS